MIKGIYTAASGMMCNSRAIDIIGNNVANSNTTGFKKDSVVFSSFGDALTYRVSNYGTASLGQTTNGVVVQEIFTDYKQSPCEQTNNDLDLALEGEGFFTLRLNDGTLALTRNGQFTIDGNGCLSDFDGNHVLGKSGSIQVDNANFMVDAKGNIYIDGEYFDTLRISNPTDPQSLQKRQGGLLIGFNEQNQLPFTGQVRQGYLESASLDLIGEMTGLIESSRAFQSCTQIVKMMDSVMNKTINELCKI
ncbi:MAG: flagellar hook-basal body protein [Bacillota bacterium]|jgi:flagellar basal-body rod protein FlgF